MDCEEDEMIADNMILVETDAEFWINNRDQLKNPDFIIEYNRNFYTKARDEMLLKGDTIDPQNPLHDGIVEIIDYIGYGGLEHYISIIYHKDPDFMKIAKSNGFKWSTFKKLWIKELPKDVSHQFEKEAEEIGRILLKCGFAVCVHNEKVKQILEEG